MSILSYNVKLNFTNKQHETNLIKTMELHKDMWNQVSVFIFDNKMKTDGKLIHDKFYYPLMKKYPNTPSQILIRVFNDVISTYKTLKTNIRQHLIDKDDVTEPCNKHNLSIRLDKRIFSMKNNVIKITTVDSPNKEQSALLNIMIS